MTCFFSLKDTEAGLQVKESVYENKTLVTEIDFAWVALSLIVQ